MADFFQSTQPISNIDQKTIIGQETTDLWWDRQKATDLWWNIDSVAGSEPFQTPIQSTQTSVVPQVKEETKPSEIIEKSQVKPTEPIDTSEIGTTTQQLNITPSPVNSETRETGNQIISSVKSIIDNVINPLKQQIQATNEQLTQQLKQTPTLATSPQIINAQSMLSQQQQKLLDLEPDLLNLSQQLADLKAREANELAMVEGQAIPQGIITGQQAAIQRKYAAQITAVSAQLAVKTAMANYYQGNIDNANKAIDQAVKMLSYDISQQKDDLKYFIDRNDKLLSTLDEKTWNMLDKVFDELSLQEKYAQQDYRDKLAYIVDAGLDLTPSEIKSKSLGEIAMMAARKKEAESAAKADLGYEGEIRFALSQVNNDPAMAARLVWEQFGANLSDMGFKYNDLYNKAVELSKQPLPQTPTTEQPTQQPTQNKPSIISTTWNKIVNWVKSLFSE